jgi:hypothetical protein
MILMVVFLAQPLRMVQALFLAKVPVPKHRLTNTAYTVKCKQCEDSYVGITK